MKFFDKTPALYADGRNFRDACRAGFKAGGFEIYNGKCGVERRVVQVVLGRKAPAVCRGVIRKMRICSERSVENARAEFGGATR